MRLIGILDDEDYQHVDMSFGLNEDGLIGLHAFYKLLLYSRTTKDPEAVLQTYYDLRE